jgi:hypothetical protein
MLVSNEKKISVKLPGRIWLFKNGAPDIPFSQSLVITCWGTWLYAIVHYAENFEIFVQWQISSTGMVFPILQYCGKYLSTQMN